MKSLILGILLSLVVSCTSMQKKDSSPGPVASPTPAASPAPAAPSKFVAAKATAGLAGNLETKCKRDTDERILTVVPKGVGCELHYQKFGASEVKASSSVGQRHCETIRGKMRANLETAGFKCQ